MREHIHSHESKHWTGDDERPDDARAAALETEDRREREWHELSALAKDFAQAYGNDMMLRCVADALRK